MSKMVDAAARVMEAEVLPVKCMDSVRSAGDDLTRQTVEFHDAAKHHAGLSVVYAALCGFAIRRKKAELGHGNGFTEWRDALPFSQSTANRYVQFSEEIEQRLPNYPREGNLDPLQLAKPEQVEEFAVQIRDVTGGNTYRQLLFDWEICRPPRPLGGNPVLQKWLAEFHPRVVATRVEELPAKLAAAFGRWCAEQDAEAVRNHDPVAEARDTALRHYTDIHNRLYDFMNRHFADLPRGDLRALRDLLSDYCKQIERTLQGV